MVEIFVAVVAAFFNADFGIPENSSDTVGNGNIFGCITVIIALKCGNRK